MSGISIELNPEKVEAMLISMAGTLRKMMVCKKELERGVLFSQRSKPEMPHTLAQHEVLTQNLEAACEAIQTDAEPWLAAWATHLDLRIGAPVEFKLDSGKGHLTIAGALQRVTLSEVFPAEARWACLYLGDAQLMLSDHKGGRAMVPALDQLETVALPDAGASLLHYPVQQVLTAQEGVIAVRYPLQERNRDKLARYSYFISGATLERTG